MYKRYRCNSGQVERVAERPGPQVFPGPPLPPPVPPPPPPEAPGLLSGFLGRFLSGLREGPETEDLLLTLILYLLYRESGDTELLLILGAMLIL